MKVPEQDTCSASDGSNVVERPPGSSLEGSGVAPNKLGRGSTRRQQPPEENSKGVFDGFGRWVAQ